MVKVWSYLAIEPRPGERTPLSSVVDDHEVFSHDATHDGELICIGSQGDHAAEDLLEGAAEHVRRAVLVWETDEGPEVSGRYYEHDGGDVELEEVVGGTSKRAVTDYLAREYGMDGPF